MDADMRKELKVRARVKSIYNKTEADFDSKQEWDDYLEQREDLIFNLAEAIDVEQTEAKLADYERANRDAIAINAAKKAEDSRAAAVLPDTAGTVIDGADAGATTAAASAASGQQGLQYLAALPPGMTQASNRPAPVTDGTTGAAADSEELSERERRARMALASGWTSAFAERRAVQLAYNSVFIR